MGTVTTLLPIRVLWSVVFLHFPSHRTRLGASRRNQCNFHISLIPFHHLSTTFELIYVKITDKHTSVRAKQTECGMLPWHTFNTNPCRKDGSVSPASSSGLPAYTALMSGSQMSPPPGHRGLIKALGSQASIMSKVRSSS